MKIIINAVQAFINSIRVDIELNNLAKEMERKGLFLTDPNRIQFKDDMGGIECYAVTKGDVRRIRSVGFNPKITDGTGHRTEIKAILLRHNYTIEKVYALPKDGVAGKCIKAFITTPRTMGE